MRKSKRRTRTLFKRLVRVHGFTVFTFADAVGVTQPTIDKWHRKQDPGKIPYEYLEKMAKLLKITVDELIIVLERKPIKLDVFVQNN